jgi:hypothetical protein
MSEGKGRDAATRRSNINRTRTRSAEQKKAPPGEGEAKLASARKGRSRSGERELRSLGISCTSCRHREALAVCRPLAWRVDHVTVSERLDRGRHLAGRVDNCAVTERPNHRRWLHRRLDRLDRQARRLGEAAACMGRRCGRTHGK